MRIELLLLLLLLSVSVAVVVVLAAAAAVVVVVVVMSGSEVELLPLRINKYYPLATRRNVTLEGQKYHRICNNPRSRR
jgi:hypothetical protein